MGGDLLLFGLFFGTYAYYRADDPGAYAAGQALLDRHLGFVNTLLLLTGSWLVAYAVTHMTATSARRAGRLFGVAALTGLGFIANKALEWGTLFGAGISIYTSDFFMFYFMFTGIHALHVVLGVGVLTYFCVRMIGQAPELPSGTAVEGAGIFWHLVDLLWIVLFALFYLANDA